MRILFVVPYVPSLIRVRPYHLLQGLARRGHDVVVSTHWTDANEEAQIDQLRRDGFNVHASHLPTWRSLVACLSALPTKDPLQAAYSWDRQHALRLSELVDSTQFDIIHVEHLRGARYGLHLKQWVSRSTRPRSFVPPVVFDSVDCISHLFRLAQLHSRSLKGRLMTALERERSARLESRLLAEVDQVVAVSAGDAMALEVAASSFGVYDHAPLSVVGNGVDLEYFRPNWDGRDDSTIVISGKMSYHANVTAVKYLAQEVMPLVWASRPDARLVIVGADPPSDVRSLQNSLPDESPPVCRGISVTGRVDDIRPYLWKASLCVAPIVYGAGVQNKVLEAMSCGAPVVASPQAVSTLQCSNGRHVLIGNNADELATHVLNVLGNRSLRDRLSLAGRDFVERYHTWDTSIRALERVYLDALESTQRNTSAPGHLVRQV